MLLGVCFHHVNLYVCVSVHIFEYTLLDSVCIIKNASDKRSSTHCLWSHEVSQA